MRQVCSTSPTYVRVSLEGAPPARSPAMRLTALSPARWQTRSMLTLFGALAVTFMMLMYALEGRHRGFVLAFACGCALSSVYGFLAGTWPFGVVEAIWALIALQRFSRRTAAAP